MAKDAPPPVAETIDATPRRWPRCGASAIIFRGPEVLLVQRAKGGFVGLWSPPGGHIEPGEHAHLAAKRETLEETGLDVTIDGLLDVHDVITRDDRGGLIAHYLLAVYFGRSAIGTPVAASDCRDARFFTEAEFAGLPTTPGLLPLIERARVLIGHVDCP